MTDRGKPALTCFEYRPDGPVRSLDANLPNSDEVCDACGGSETATNSWHPMTSRFHESNWTKPSTLLKSYEIVMKHQTSPDSFWFAALSRLWGSSPTLQLWTCCASEADLYSLWILSHLVAFSTNIRSIQKDRKVTRCFAPQLPYECCPQHATFSYCSFDSICLHMTGCKRSSFRTCW